jgi:hypothetical protein
MRMMAVVRMVRALMLIGTVGAVRAIGVMRAIGSLGETPPHHSGILLASQEVPGPVQ